MILVPSFISLEPAWMACAWLVLRNRGEEGREEGSRARGRRATERGAQVFSPRLQCLALLCEVSTLARFGAAPALSLVDTQDPQATAATRHAGQNTARGHLCATTAISHAATPHLASSAPPPPLPHPPSHACSRALCELREEDPAPATVRSTSG